MPLLSKPAAVAALVFAGLGTRWCLADDGADGIPSELLVDDECEDGVCALNELQLRASAKASEEAGEEEEEFSAASSGRRRYEYHSHLKWAKTEFGVPAEAKSVGGGPHTRRRRLVLWKATPMVDEDEQPVECAGHRLKKGYQGCCAGQLYDFVDMGCCGSLLYRTNELSCCRHRNQTATIYNALTSNCCDDPLKKNKEEGVICHMEGEESSCCHIEAVGGRRRRGTHDHHKHR